MTSELIPSSNNTVNQIEHLYNHFKKEEEEDYDFLAKLYTDDALIMDRKYQAVLPEEVVQQLNHLTTAQKAQLTITFEKYKKVFDGTWGKHPTAKFDTEVVIPGTKPIYQQPYPVPFRRKSLFNRELNNMINYGIFTKIGESEWGFPSFIIPKKDG